jgi:ABC-type lipoprotein export system ATPase subunit
MQIFKKLNEEGITIILVTHNDVIANFANKRVFLMDGGDYKGNV